jgi:polyhydroxyalkanoate synthesis repressor PhaR
MHVHKQTGPGKAMAMAENVHESKTTLEIRKYSNRRYYDSTRSCHVTLEDIHELIRDGYEVRVTDSQSSEDITSKVLAQIILDYDPLKLDAFPAAMLHEVIRSNEKIVKDFIEKYFSQAFHAFLDSQRQFESFMRHAMGLGAQSGAMPDFARLISGMLWPPFMPQNQPSEPKPPVTPPSDPTDAEDLQRQLDRLRRQMEQIQSTLRNSGDVTS